ncbi:SNF1-activating kinase 1 [Candida viswanathii]|uniref:SNF1-activating kinase 1 n=1 Tax=Candida viswanathii TaxID=5486 RepID=A0A367XS35_9ASCO|nr:SNF1-activating kinase 1 [Candida viswanathii]
MKKCHHKHVVALKEVLDDVNSLKIYLVLEYMEKGEIKWKKLSSDKKESMDNSATTLTIMRSMCGSRINRQPQKHHSFSNETDLLSDEFSPNLTFKQSRKIFRDVLLGLEYLHMQVSSIVISSQPTFNELDLAKTAVPQHSLRLIVSVFPDEALPQGKDVCLATDPPSHRRLTTRLIFGPSDYCQPTLEFPKDIESFKSPGVVSEDDLSLPRIYYVECWIRKEIRITIADIKVHPFTLMDLDDNIEGLNELFHHNGTAKEPLNFNLEDHDILQAEIDNAIIGIGTRFKRGLVKAIRAGGLKDHEIRDKFAALHLEHSKSENSEDLLVGTPI